MGYLINVILFNNSSYSMSPRWSSQKMHKAPQRSSCVGVGEGMMMLYGTSSVTIP
ncbi:MAG: hypothetical protein WCO37_05590 [Bacteroidota bacterium]